MIMLIHIMAFVFYIFFLNNINMYATLDHYQSFSSFSLSSTKEHFENVYVVPFSSFIKNSTKKPNLFRIGPYRLDQLPSSFQSILENGSLYHPGSQQVYLDDHDSKSFMRSYDPELLKLYQCLKPGAYRADLVRLCLLEKYGGTYADLSLRFLQPLPYLSEEVVLINDINFRADQKGVAITNGYMKAPPHHPLLQAMIRHIATNITNRQYGESSLDVTGPIALRKAWEAFFGREIIDKGTQGQMKLTKADKEYSMFWMDYRQAQPFNYIEYKGVPIIQVKFEGYKELMYDAFQTDPYWHMWNQRDIYQ